MFILCKLIPTTTTVPFLVLLYKKEVVFVPKSGQIVVKFDRLTSSYKTGRPTAKSDISQKEKSELEKDID